MTDTTPTPVDPTDKDTLFSLFVDEAAGGARASDAIGAVARAVLPEGYVAVPVDDVRNAICSSMGHWNEDGKASAARIIALLPKVGESDE